MAQSPGYDHDIFISYAHNDNYGFGGRPGWVDISHESLIRQWKTLADWVDQEADCARIYQRLAQSAELHADGKAGLYEETDLQVALDWQRQQQPNAEWAARYRLDFNLVMGFLEQSVMKQKTNRLFLKPKQFDVKRCILCCCASGNTDDRCGRLFLYN